MMRLIKYILILQLFSTVTLSAQKKDIRLNFGFQVNLPERLFNPDISKFNEKNSGFGFHLMPVWNYSDNLSFGINFEYAGVTEDFQTDNIGNFDIISFSPSANYYFTEFKIRPFVGLGFGMYHVLRHKPVINIGIRPIIGISIYDYFNLSMEYNRILADINVDPKVLGDFDNYYLAVKASFRIGIMKSKKQKQGK